MKRRRKAVPRTWLRGDPSLRARRRMLFFVFVVALLVIIARAVQLQVVQHDRWQEKAQAQHHAQIPLDAPRGDIFDRNGVPLATTREVVRLAVAPREVDEPDTVIARLSRVPGISRARARSAVQSDRPWVVIPGTYEVAVTASLEDLGGVHFRRMFERFYPHGPLAREILGPVAADGEALGGIELEFDEQLKGTPGVAVVSRTGSGAPIPGAMVVAEPAVPGQSIRLTLDYDLQQIATEALELALEETDAGGGDILLLDVKTGSVLAAVSRRTGSSATWSSIIEPYEPGSTLKPFLVSALLAEDKARLDERVDARDGVLVGTGGRVIRDVHGYDTLSVREALTFSSNVVMAQLAPRLRPITQYRYLRDFGFGTLTGIQHPAESAGRLRRPEDWSGMSQQSLAIGYEVAVTPLQMALAYGALANEGTLMAPRLVLSTQPHDGKGGVQYPPRRIRRVVPETVAHEVSAVLAAAVEFGTGQQAGLGRFRVAGKTGTARRMGDEGYEEGAYTASFAGFFPADEPQVVFLVKIDDPQGAYYGGLTAAPALRRTLAAALAAQRSILDRPLHVASPPTPTPIPAPPEPESATPHIVSFDSAGAVRPTSPPSPLPDSVVVPAIADLTLRDAVAALRRAGLHVVLVGQGAPLQTEPASGATVATGSAVRLLTARSSAGRRP